MPPQGAGSLLDRSTAVVTGTSPQAAGIIGEDLNVSAGLVMY